MLALLMATQSRAQEASESLDLDGREASGEPGDGEHAEARSFVDVVLGLGLTERSIVAGSAKGRRRVNVDFVPALGLRLDMGLVDAPFRFGLSAAYQTSVAAEAFEPAPSGAGETTALRSHRFVGGVMGHWLLTQDGDALGMQLGYGMRAFYSVETLGVPAFTLHGPTVALQLQITVLGRVELRVAPELQLLSGVSKSLQDTAGLKAPGFALGAEGDLRLRLWSFLALGVSYREAHASLGSVFAQGFTDQERYLLFTGHVRWL